MKFRLKKTIRLLGINLLVLAGLLLLVTISAYFVEVYRINAFFSFRDNKAAQMMQPDSIAMFTHKYDMYLYENYGTPEQKLSLKKRTNNYGFKEDTNVVDKRDNEYRVLITGDSHTDGALKENADSFINVWEKKLNANSTETYYNCLNGGTGYYTFRNYTGFLKKYKKLKPDVYLVNIFIGNDFREAPLYEDDRTSIPNVYRSIWTRLQRKTQSKTQQSIPRNQGIEQTEYFRLFPKQKQVALDLAKKYLAEIKTICKTENIRFIVSFLPSNIEVNPEFKKEVKTKFDWTDEDVNTNRELANRLALWLKKQGIEFIDLNPEFSRIKDSLYWQHDLHINKKAHALIGELFYNKIKLD